MSEPAELRTRRLRLRALREDDRPAVLRVFDDPAQSEYFAADLSDPGQCDAMMDRRLGWTGPAGQGHWAIELDGRVIGLAHLRPSWELPGDVAELGYFVEPAAAGSGIATEAAEALVRHGFSTLGLPAIWAVVHEENAPSRAVAHRLGFLDVGGGIHYDAPHRVLVGLPDQLGAVHHTELWVPDVVRAERTLGWLLERLGWREYQRWEHGVSWRLGAGYLVVERSPAQRAEEHDRMRPGLNHLGLHAGTPEQVDELTRAAVDRGWRPLFADRYPYAGGPDHYAAYLENEDGFEIELVASATVQR